MYGRFVALGGAVLAAVFAIVLAVHGTDAEGLRVLIRATARSSALLVAFTLVSRGIRPIARYADTAFVVFAISHALHLTAILALAATSSPEEAHLDLQSVVGGSILYGVLFSSVIVRLLGVASDFARGTEWWFVIAFFIGFSLRPELHPIYLLLMALMAGAFVLRLSLDGRLRPQALRSPAVHHP